MNRVRRSTRSGRLAAFVAILAAPIAAFGALILPKTMATPAEPALPIAPAGQAILVDSAADTPQRCGRGSRERSVTVVSESGSEV